MARAALEAGASRLAVARLNEAQALRQEGIRCPVLVFGFIPEEQIELALLADITITIYRLDMAIKIDQIAKKIDKKATIHLKVDSGMGRLGFKAEEDAVSEIIMIKALSNLDLEGIYTHFAAADETNKDYSRWQLDRFLSLVGALEKKGITFKLKHSANSAAIIDFPESYLDLVRPGIMMYGLYPSEEVNKSNVDLMPAMSLLCRIAHIKKVVPGTKISYGCTYTVNKETVVASLPLGYGDGYPRLLSSVGQVMILGQRAPVIGRVCMDQCMVDVGHIPGVNINDVVLIFGKKGQGYLPVEEVALWLKTINYEVVCLVGSRVPRIYI
ncbi:hypothetical protein N752_20925 [Desulforamulus aquiferis]|nr:hypothetical protein N752_20925 [Desulforamulus aquiferis]